MPALNVLIVTPAPRGAQNGNRITALRWARALRHLGHRVRVAERYDGGEADLLIALHAGKSHDSIMRFASEQPLAPRVVALTGTDLYVDRDRDPRVARSLELSSAIVVLQERALDELSPSEREKARAIVQSASAVPPERGARGFVACVLAHMRPVKDPLRAAFAARLVPDDSELVVLHAGRALDPDLEIAAEREARESSRYRWLGELPRKKALALLAGSDVLVVSSHAEGGANVVTEAAAAGVAVVGTRIAGTIGLLGEDHPGYFAPGDTRELAELLVRVERDPALLAELRARSRALASQVSPERELEAWRRLIDHLSQKGGNMTEPRLTQLVQGGG